MIIWSGRGIFSVLVLIACMFLTVTLFSKEIADYAFAMSFTIAGFFSWFFGKKWNNKPQRILRDEQTGERVTFKNRHTLFWIPMQYIGYIFISGGTIILFQSSVVFGSISIIILVLLVYKDFASTNPEKQKTTEEKIIKKIKVLKEEKQELDEVGEGREKIRIRKEKEDPSRFMPK